MKQRYTQCPIHCLAKPIMKIWELKVKEGHQVPDRIQVPPGGIVSLKQSNTSLLLHHATVPHPVGIQEHMLHSWNKIGYKDEKKQFSVIYCYLFDNPNNNNLTNYSFFFLQEAVKGQFFTVKKTKIVFQVSWVLYMYCAQHPEHKIWVYLSWPDPDSGRVQRPDPMVLQKQGNYWSGLPSITENALSWTI